MNVPAQSQGLGPQASWAPDAMAKGLVEVFWLWHVLGSWAAGVGMAGWGGPLHNDSLSLSRNASEPEAGMWGRGDTEDVGT